MTNIKKSIQKRIYKLFQKIYSKKVSKKNRNKTFSIICNNCIGGLIYHWLGLPFTSPTINLFFENNGFYKMVQNLRYYMEIDLEFIKDDNYNCPVAMLDDVKIIFNHYKTEEEAREKWETRKKRINYDEIYIITDDGYASEEDMLSLQNVDCKKYVIFTTQDKKEIPNTVWIKNLPQLETARMHLLYKSLWTGVFPFQKYFNWLKWLNN